MKFYPLIFVPAMCGCASVEHNFFSGANSPPPVEVAYEPIVTYHDADKNRVSPPIEIDTSTVKLPRD